ncbi:DNA-binding protein, partial [Bacillus sp. S34]|nr:DNA-binding protein [Bacillus sp. S34]
MNKLQKPVLKALDYAIAAKHASFEAVHVAIDDTESARLRAQWAEYGIEVVSSEGVRRTWLATRRSARLSAVVDGHWWENFLHNHRGRRIRKKLLLVHGVTVALVPWLLDSSELLYGRRSRPLPGQERRGEPIRPALRRSPHGVFQHEAQDDRLLRSAQRN